MSQTIKKIPLYITTVAYSIVPKQRPSLIEWLKQYCKQFKN